jgi:hypothetical protein
MKHILASLGALSLFAASAALADDTPAQRVVSSEYYPLCACKAAVYVGGSVFESSLELTLLFQGQVVLSDFELGSGKANGVSSAETACFDKVSAHPSCATN